MDKKEKKLSLASMGLKYKLKIAFYLMSVLPLLVCIYLVSNYILPQVGLRLDITLSILISIFIALIGFFVVKEVFDHILSISTDARLIAAGDIDRMVEIKQPDEIGDLGGALNQLRQRIRSNMDELKNYSEKTAQINLEIQNRVLVLSSLLQISSLISQGQDLEDILRLTTEKSRLLAESDAAYLLFKEESQDAFYMKVADGINSGYLLKIKLEPKEGIFEKLIKTSKPLILDKQNILSDNLSKDFYEKFRLKNTLAQPVYLRGKVTGILGIGNTRENFLYGKDDMEFLDIFAKQVAIAIENDILLSQVKKLEIRDTLTGLYNEAYISSCLKDEIKRAISYQRPCAFILINIDNFKKFQENFGSAQAESALKRIAILIKDSVTDIDRVARTKGDEFAIVLPEKTKRQAQQTAEDIRKRIEFASSEEQDINKRITVSAGVSENPLDGIDGQELMAKAKESLALAKTQGKNRIL